MKKVIMMLVMLFTIGMNSYANDNKIDVHTNFEKYELKVDIDKLGFFLDLSSAQEKDMNEIEKELCNDLKFASSEADETSRDKIAKNAIDKHIKHVHCVLDNEQYHKYLKVLNVTLINRGILK